jgi:hypothetical protein
LSFKAGFRRAEVSTVGGEELTSIQIPQALYFFIIGGNVLRCPSAAELASMAEGDQVFTALARRTRDSPYGAWPCTARFRGK